jgi:hypothetical protein
VLRHYPSLTESVNLEETTMTRAHATLLVAIGAAIIFAPLPLAAQRPAEACCSITSIGTRADPFNGGVAARDNTTGQTFQFRVSDGALLRSLKVGQAVWADHAAGNVRVDPGEACCGILAQLTVTSAEPFDGIVTARDPATGRTVRFNVGNTAQLGTFRAGQVVWVDQLAGTVGVSPAEACCRIIR